MKRILPLAVLLALTACTGPVGSLGRLFPDGSSVRIIKPTLTVSMTGAGNLSADEISWIGTNGFPLPDGATNLTSSGTTTTTFQSKTTR